MGNGCCTGCCKKTSILATDTQTIIDETGQKEIPSGYVKIYGGFAVSDGTYTSPVLSIHKYKESSKKTGKKHTKGILGEEQTVQLSHQSKTDEENLSDNEEVQIIPVEDIFSIKFITDVQKEVIEKNTSNNVEAVDGETCCKSLCCCKSLRCCPSWRCCNAKVGVINSTRITNVNKKRTVEIEKRMTDVSVAKQDVCCPPLRFWCCKVKNKRLQREETITKEYEATRAITIIIEHAKYGFPNTLSHVQCMAQDEQEKFYKDKGFNSHEFQQTNFQKNKSQAEQLCRIVMQLKSMFKTNQTYPNVKQLKEIIDQNYDGLFGDEHHEQLSSLLRDKPEPKPANMQPEKTEE
ncbi:unnamed protein product [Didymodactylos carnosus]|uniref:Uncharacterized protein n=1 Tax=Didymodactylos carnosus TaxID=1234261 RepID=A0A814DNW1_9BILA|nr:unnamed protein product [Didymodactylos carnosus]CAF0956608.1 unnamed protein product [Didymodactylos carnosus]CAF3534820.1 unnamed protein product [Didymodactylos carnosus]CAF3731573.1 unnamed protein product [Didymodactylos carnosus]